MKVWSIVSHPRSRPEEAREKFIKKMDLVKNRIYPYPHDGKESRMSIIKFNTSAGVRYRVDYRPEGRESRRSRKVFERRCDAEEYLAMLREKAKMNRVPGLRSCDFESTTFKDEAKHWLTSIRNLIAHDGQNFTRNHSWL